MKRPQATNVLAKAFAALPKADRQRLEYHRQKGTPICCGKTYAYYQFKGAG